MHRTEVDSSPPSLLHAAAQSVEASTIRGSRDSGDRIMWDLLGMVSVMISNQAESCYQSDLLPTGKPVFLCVVFLVQGFFC